jgi:stage III sporulation protein AB
MIKFMLIAFIVYLSWRAGLMYAKSLEERANQIKTLQGVIRRAGQEITFNREKSYLALFKASKNTFLENIFENIKQEFDEKNGKTLDESFRDNFAINKTSLDKKDIQPFYEYLSALATANAEGEKSARAAAFAYLEEREQLAKEVSQKNGKVAKILGLSLGALIAIFLI